MRFVPLAEWGRDHWSVLAYVETRCVDAGGVLDHDHMTTNRATHPGLEGPRVTASGLLRDEPFKYHTRLRDGVELGHDNWNCFYDREEAGLVVDVGTGVQPRAKMTPLGVQLAEEIRAHKAGGGSFSSFVPRTVG